MSLGLLNRQPTFLSDPAWTTAPWEWHPKSVLDWLLDIITQLPSIFQQTDRLLLLQPTLSRRREAQGLLRLCIEAESQFEHWLAMVDGQRTPEKPLTYWFEEMTDPGHAIPFSYTFTFSDSMTGIMFLYNWMAHVLLYKCMETLDRIISQPVVDVYPDSWPDAAAADPQISVARYRQAREMAADICRGLDSALENALQPDLLVAPMRVALDLYKEINAASSQDGALEILWLDAFRGRLAEKGQHVATALQGKQWVQLARF